MKRKSTVILPLASALAALSGSSMVVAEAKSVPTGDAAVNSEAAAAQKVQPNTLVSTGESLLGFIMTEQPDGTVVAQHASHASHASHHSHSSSR
jgi:hypothetical protein